MPYIEFSTLIQKRLSDIFLYNIGKIFTVVMGFSVFNDFFYLVYIIADFYPAASV